MTFEGVLSDEDMPTVLMVDLDPPDSRRRKPAVNPNDYSKFYQIWFMGLITMTANLYRVPINYRLKVDDSEGH